MLIRFTGFCSKHNVATQAGVEKVEAVNAVWTPSELGSRCKPLAA